MTLLHARLAGFYLAYYSTVGSFMAYWSPYLAARGFSAADIGLAYALMGASRATVPIAWGWLADRRGRRIGTIRAASLASLLLFMAIPHVDGVRPVMLLMLGYTLFWNALLPQFEVVALNHLRASGGDYSRVRLWGSVGFIAAVLGVGPLLDAFGVIFEPWFVAVLFAAMAVSTWMVPESPVVAPAPHQAQGSGAWQVVRRPATMALLFVCFCSQLSFAPYYNFFTLFLDAHGYSQGRAGQLWAIGVVAEIGVFVIAGRAIARVGARRLMLWVMATTALRWLLIGYAVESVPALIFAQLLHAVSFGMYHSLAMYYVQALFPPHGQGRGQAIYSSAAYGLGGSLGSLASGHLWDALSPASTFAVASAVALLGLGVAWRYLPEPGARACQ